MTWEKKGSYHLENGSFTIATINIADKTIYSLFNHGQFVKRFKSVDRAKEYHAKLVDIGDVVA